MKADKEDLDDALADKADHNVVNRKVSHDQFDAACDDLSKGLEEAFGKLTQQVGQLNHHFTGLLMQRLPLWDRQISLHGVQRG